jgi:hypothetical protein
VGECGAQLVDSVGEVQVRGQDLQDRAGSNFTIEITRSETIREAREIIATADRKDVVGRIIKTQASYNPQWDVHYNPDTVSYADGAPEICSASIHEVEDHLDEAGGAFLPGVMPFAPVFAFSPGLTCGISVPASTLRRDCPRGARASNQRPANASGTGDTTFSIISTGGSSHTGAEGREPRCEATKKVTGT